MKMKKIKTEQVISLQSVLTHIFRTRSVACSVYVPQGIPNSFQSVFRNEFPRVSQKLQKRGDPNLFYHIPLCVKNARKMCVAQE